MVTIKKVVIANPYSVKVVPDKEHGDYIVHVTVTKNHDEWKVSPKDVKILNRVEKAMHVQGFYDDELTGAEDSSGFLFPNHNTATHTFQRVHLDTVEDILLGEVCRA